MVILKFVIHVQWHCFRVCSSSTCFIIICDHVELSQEILVGSKFSGGGGSHLVLSMLCSNLTPNNGNSDCNAMQAGESRTDSCNVHPNIVTAMLCKLETAERTAAMFTPTLWLQCCASWRQQNGQLQCSPQHCDCNAVQAGDSRTDSCNVHPNIVTAMLCKLETAERTAAMFTPTLWLQCCASWRQQNGQLQCSPQQCDCMQCKLERAEWTVFTLANSVIACNAS